METQETLEQFVNLKCDFIQGFFFKTTAGAGVCRVHPKIRQSCLQSSEILRYYLFWQLSVHW